MAIQYVALATIPGGGWAGLRGLCGVDEQQVDDTDTGVAIRLLDQLLVEDPRTTIPAGSALKLTAADRDRLLAAVYLDAFGPLVSGTRTCSHCDHLFDLDFHLPDLVAAVRPDMERERAAQNGHLVFRLDSGGRFRLPTGEDEFAVWHLPPAAAEQALLQRCLVPGDITPEPEEVLETMQAVAPVLTLDLDAQCPECGTVQPVHFDMQTYLLSALEAEQSRLAEEVHQIAVAYGWRLSEILSLSRRQRRTYVSLIGAAASTQVER